MQGVAEQAVGKEQDDGERDGGNDERVELAERPQKLVGDDQKHGAQYGAEDRAAAAQYGRYDDLDPDGDVDHGVDGGGAHIEDEHGAGRAGKQRTDAESRDLVLGDVEAERCRFDRVLAAGLENEADRRAGPAVQEK